MTAVVEHLEKFGINTFDHPRIGDYHSFVIIYKGTALEKNFKPVQFK